MTTTHSLKTRHCPVTLCTDGDAAPLPSAPIPRALRSVRRCLWYVTGAAAWIGIVKLSGCNLLHNVAAGVVRVALVAAMALPVMAHENSKLDPSWISDNALPAPVYSSTNYFVEWFYHSSIVGSAPISSIIDSAHSHTNTPTDIAYERRKAKLESMTLPELRAIGPVNPLNPANDGTYRDHRRTYCELGLLKGVQCTNSLQVHHAAMTDKALKLLGFPEMWKEPRNLVTACALKNCPQCGQNCHFDVLHSKDFRSTDKVLSQFLQFRLDYIEWILSHPEPVDVEQ